MEPVGNLKITGKREKNATRAGWSAQIGFQTQSSNPSIIIRLRREIGLRRYILASSIDGFLDGRCSRLSCPLSITDVPGEGRPLLRYGTRNHRPCSSTYDWALHCESNNRLRERVCRCTSRLSNHTGSLLPRAGFFVWGLDMGFRRRLNPRLFLVASENGTLRAIGVCERDVAHGPRPGVHRHCRQMVPSILVRGLDDRCVSYARRGERCRDGGLGIAGRCLERKRVYRVLARVGSVWADVHQTSLVILGRSLSRLFCVQKTDVE